MTPAEFWAIGAVLYFFTMGSTALRYTVCRCDFQTNWNNLPTKFRWAIVLMFSAGFLLASAFWFVVLPCQAITAFKRWRRGVPIIG